MNCAADARGPWKLGDLKPVSLDYKIFMSSSHDCTMRIWDVVAECTLQTLEAHPNWASSVAFSPDDNFIVAALNYNKFRVLNAVTGTVLQTLELVVGNGALSSSSPAQHLKINSWSFRLNLGASSGSLAVRCAVVVISDCVTKEVNRILFLLVDHPATCVAVQNN